MRQRDPVAHRAAVKQRYYALKSKRQCVKCTSPLQPDEGVVCAVCNDRHRATAAVSRERNRDAYNAGKAAQLRHRYHVDVEASRARQRQLRADKAARGECANCTDPVVPGFRRCAYHLAKHRRYGLKSRILNGQTPRRPPAPIPSREPKRRDVVPIFDPGRARRAAVEYQPIDERERNMRVRVLRAIYRLTHTGEWCSAAEMLEAADVYTEQVRGGTGERNAAESMLRNLVDWDLVERAGTKGKYQYRVSTSGRVEVKAWRTNGLPAVGGGKRAA